MKANIGQMRTAIDRGDPAIRLYLLYGPDEAGAHDLAARLARRMGPDAERVDLEPSLLKNDPGALAAEAASASLFASARHIRIDGIAEESVEAVALLLAAERAGNPVAAVGPSLKATGKLLKLALASPAALCCPCYAPDGADAVRLATTIAQERGVRITAPIAERLLAACGGDRAVLTQEIEKLALFVDAAPERPGVIDDNAIDLIGADVGDSELFRAVSAAIDGRPADLARELAALREAGGSPIPLLRNLVRRLMMLATIRAEADAGATFDTLLERHHVHFREKPATMRALRLWSSARLAETIARLRDVERATMSGASAGSVLADAAITAIARSISQLRR